MSRRNDIKNKLAEVLSSTGFSAAGSVYLSRVDMVKINKLPAVCIYAPEVQSEAENDRRGYVHTEIIRIVCLVTGPTRVDRVDSSQKYADEALDDLEDEVRAIMLSPSTRGALGGLVRDLIYKGAKVMPADPDKEDNVWMSNMEFNFTWAENIS